MNKDLFSAEDYRDYLNTICGKTKSGMKATLARVAGTFNSYISKVLNYDGHLTLEQAQEISSYLGHSEKEKQFFFLLLQKGRAGTRKLQDYFSNELDKMKAEQLQLSRNLKSEKKLSAEIESRYYSQWLFSAVDVALMVGGLSRKEKIAAYFGVPLARVSQALDFLVEHGLAEVHGGEYRTSSQHMHLASDSSNIIKHHLNWRVKTIERLQNEMPAGEDLHYSVVASLGEKDLVKLRKMIVDFLKEANSFIDASPSEVVCAIGIDLFELGKRA